MEFHMFKHILAVYLWDGIVSSEKAIRYWLDDPVGARSSATIQTRSGAHPAPCTMDTGSLSRGYSK
jgi:hypothetical protein